MKKKKLLEEELMKKKQNEKNVVCGETSKDKLTKRNKTKEMKD